MKVEDGVSRLHRDVKKQTTADETKDRGIDVVMDPRVGHEVSFSVGRTIGTGEFEFARFDVEIEATGADPYRVLGALRAAVKEMADREESAILSVERPVKPIDDMDSPDIWNRRLRISYGMTLQGKKRYESHRFDVQLREPIPGDEPMESAVKRFGAWLEVQVREEVARVKGGGEDTGL